MFRSYSADGEWSMLGSVNMVRACQQKRVFILSVWNRGDNILRSSPAEAHGSRWELNPSIAGRGRSVRIHALHCCDLQDPSR
jgi:hypothetical protein